MSESNVSRAVSSDKSHSRAPIKIYLTEEQANRVQEMHHEAFEHQIFLSQLLADCHFTKTELKTAAWMIGELMQLLHRVGEERFLLALQEQGIEMNNEGASA